jgi:hypothetical protein
VFENECFEIASGNEDSIIHVYLDETRLNLISFRKYARSRKGQRAYAVVKNGRGLNVSAVAAMFHKGLIGMKTRTHGFTAQLYADFIRDTVIRYFDTNAPPGCKKIVLIHDNAAERPSPKLFE